MHLCEIYRFVKNWIFTSISAPDAATGLNGKVTAWEYTVDDALSLVDYKQNIDITEQNTERLIKIIDDLY